jgi:hypothetical protein
MIEASTSGPKNYCHEMRASKRFPHYLEAMYLIAASVPLDEVLNQHAAGRGGGQVFSPFLSTTTGGPMMDPVGHGVSIEVVVPFPRAFPNWGNPARIEQESLLTELRREDVTRIYFSEETLMDDLLAPGSQLQDILPQEFIARSYPGSPFNRYSNNAITCWRTCEREALLPETWQKESDIQRNREYLREQYRQWGTRGLSELSKGRIVSLSEFF